MAKHTITKVKLHLKFSFDWNDKFNTCTTMAQKRFGNQMSVTFTRQLYLWQLTKNITKLHNKHALDNKQ